MTTTTYNRSLTPFVGTGNFRDFQRFADQHGLGEIYAEVEPYKDKLQHWLGVRDSVKILAITPYQDDSADFGKGGNRRVKPSSEITPFSVDPDAADALVEAWESPFPNASRYGNIRVPKVGENVQKELGVVGVAEALRKHGYKIEAANNGLFYVAGRSFDVEDYAKVGPERLELFPERDEEWFREIEKRIRSEAPEFNPDKARKVLGRLQETHSLRPAKPEDVHGLVAVLESTFPFYGTYSLKETMPKLVKDQYNRSGVSSLVYVADRKNDGKIVATVTVERSPFRFGELTDVASLDPETGDVKTNGLGFALSYMALRHAARNGMETWWTDSVADNGMTDLAGKLDGHYDGIHRTTVKLLTRQMKNRHFREKDPLVMDLFVFSGPTQRLALI
ncbi:MAG: hypothetical protein HY051_05490 [Candidatus Aenigmarchaeota archaeon]|nr:hypothetical protein [Candidatus Aenigmarchaeota archaeon]